jgi:hypothetical protein
LHPREPGGTQTGRKSSLSRPKKAAPEPDLAICLHGLRNAASPDLEGAEPVRQVLHDYFTWATTTTMWCYHESADDVPNGLSIPKRSWNGLQR